MAEDSTAGALEAEEGADVSLSDAVTSVKIVVTSGSALEVGAVAEIVPSAKTTVEEGEVAAGTSDAGSVVEANDSPFQKTSR